MYETLNLIGKELFEYFLKLYPENTVVSLCISKNNFNQFLLNKKNKKFKRELRQVFKDHEAHKLNPNIAITIAVYQSIIVVSKNINNERSFNEKLEENLKIRITDIEKWYDKCQEDIWINKVGKYFKEKSRTLLLPDTEKMKGYKHVRYPILQFIIDKNTYKDIKKIHKENINMLKEIPFDDFSKRVFSGYDKYYNSHRVNKYLSYGQYTNNELNLIAKKIIYSFIINDIHFNSNNTSIKLEQKIVTQKRHNENPELLLYINENNSFSIMENRKEILIDNSFFKQDKPYLFIYDTQNCYWKNIKKTVLKNDNHYGLLLHSSLLSNLDEIDYDFYITEYFVNNEFYFFNIGTEKGLLKQIENLFYFTFSDEKEFSLIGGLKKDKNKYYNFSLPLLILNKNITELFINDQNVSIDMDQKVIDFNSYDNFLNSGNNIIKTKESKIAEFEIYIPQESDYKNTINKGWYFSKKESFTAIEEFHLQGLHIMRKAPIILYKKNAIKRSKFTYNPLLHLLNKNIINNIKRGNQND